MLGRKGGLCLEKDREVASETPATTLTPGPPGGRHSEAEGLPAPAWVVDSGSKLQRSQRLSPLRLACFPAFAVCAGAGRRGAKFPSSSVTPEATLCPWAGQPRLARSPAASNWVLRPFLRTCGLSTRPGPEGSGHQQQQLPALGCSRRCASVRRLARHSGLGTTECGLRLPAETSRGPGLCCKGTEGSWGPSPKIPVSRPQRN